MKIEELKERRDGIVNRIPENQKETEQTTQRLQKAEIQAARFEDNWEALRKERQKVLAEQTDPSKINKQIKDLKEQREMMEDETIGLNERLSILKGEKETLEREKVEVERDILKEETIRPLLVKYNKIAQQLALLLDDMEVAIFQYGLLSYAGLEANKPPVISSRVGSAEPWAESALSSIPSLAINGEPTQAHIYDRRGVVERLKEQYIKDRRERNNKAWEEQAKRKDEVQAFLEQKYKTADCLKCKHYRGAVLGSEGDDTLTCESFSRGIPEEILTGKTSHRHMRIGSERFIFEPTGEESR
jgi:chromosome segregation ATPase